MKDIIYLPRKRYHIPEGCNYLYDNKDHEKRSRPGYFKMISNWACYLTRSVLYSKNG